MKKLLWLTVFFGLTTGQVVAQTTSPMPAGAPDPTGDWRVEEGSAHIRVAICEGVLWGVIGWEQAPGTDSENPDPALRNRPTLGMPILVNMKPDPKTAAGNKWVGKIYNAKNGKMYDSNVTLVSPNALKVQGCVLGMFCGGETWTKVAEAAETAPATAPATKGRKPAGGAATAGNNGASASAPSVNVCASVASGSGTVPRLAH